MFIDETIIEVTAGDGGNGCFSYCREKYKPKGKPNGGNGGRGGHVFINGSYNIQTLQDVSYRRSYKAPRGDHGKGSDKHGRKGKDLFIEIPIGTVIINDETGDVIFDCIDADKNIVVAKGGRGGRGNASLAYAKNPNPESAEFGKPGETLKLRFVLKVLADIGLVGRPNAGKSTFLSSISRAHPKIADYPFTTTRPHLGIVKLNESYESFVVADIPGLIEGSNTGRGLGIRFLKHIERTRVLAIMVESTADDPLAHAKELINELSEYSQELAGKPKCFIFTKTDLMLKDDLPREEGWLTMSSITKDGVPEVLKEFKRLLDETRNESV